MKFNKYSIIRTSAAFGIALAGLLSAVSVSAQTQTGSPLYVPHNASTTRPFGGRGGHVASSTLMIEREARQASTTQAHIAAGQNRGDNMLDQRVLSLQSLISRIQGMKFVSDSDKSTVEGVLNSEIAQLGNLKNKIGTDTSTTSLKNDVDSITKSYRVYALVQPQAQITAAADRVLNIVSSFSTILSKINARLASSTLASSTVAQTALSDITTKLADAKTQANAVIGEVSGLVPDNGNSTVAASNTVALKNARAKVGVAQKDLTAARKDVQTIISTLK